MDTVTRPSQPRQRSPRSDTDVPLFLGRRHSSASRSGTLNCGHRLHRKALSLDTTPLLHGSASSTYYSTLFITEPLEFSQQKPLSETAILSQPRTLHLGSLIESKLVSLSCLCSAEAKVDTDPPSSTFETPDDRQPLSSGTECDTQNAMVTRPANPSEQVNHQAIDLTRRVADRAIRVERDYSKGDGITRFSIDYPPQLTGKIEPEQFQKTVQTLNNILQDAEQVSWHSVFDNVMECLTLYTWPIFFSTHYQKCIRRLLSFIQSENESIYHPRGLSISNPVRAAFLFLEIKVYDNV